MMPPLLGQVDDNTGKGNYAPPPTPPTAPTQVLILAPPPSRVFYLNRRITILLMELETHTSIYFSR